MGDWLEERRCKACGLFRIPNAKVVPATQERPRQCRCLTCGRFVGCGRSTSTCKCSGRQRNIQHCARCAAVSIDFHNIGLTEEDWRPYEVGMVCTCPDALADGVRLVDEEPPYTFLPRAIYECAGPCGDGYGEKSLFWSGGITPEGHARYKWAWRCADCIKASGIRKGRCLKDAQITI